MKQLMTDWGRNLECDNPLPEYPRPALVRDSFFSLNGPWEYAIGKTRQPGAYTGKILVPFAPESNLSGVGQIVQPDDVLHYKKEFTLPPAFVRGRVLLHFGAVDQECEVALNGAPLGGHKGGYLPFHFDITQALAPATNTLTLCVTDKTEKSPHARGKQKLVRKSRMDALFYTPSSGIWQSVWLESVPQNYITDVRITPQYDESAVTFFIATNAESAPAQLRIFEKGRLVKEAQIPTGTGVSVPLDSFNAWTPDTPNLYDVQVSCGQDEVRSYFGMRKFSCGRDKNGILRFFLNDKPVFFNGVLDQGYWPDGLLTAPSDAALQYDIRTLKAMGYNTIRKHVKIEAPRFYYHCDKIGMMVWQDMPNGGGNFSKLLVMYLPNAFPWFGRCVKDSHYALFKRRDTQGRAQYYDDLRGMLALLSHHPSIAAWVPFNEGWGQFDAAKATALIRQTDPGRLINEACGWFDQKGGDMYSIHNYLRKLKVKPQPGRVVALSEYGGYSFPVQGHTACQKEFGYQAYASAAALAANYKRLWEEEIFPNLARGLSAAIYTQASDIEEEINGLMTYDRHIVKLDEAVVQELNQKLYAWFSENT